MKKASSPQASLLLDAMGLGDIEQVKELLAAGTDVNVRSLNGWTPLIYAALNSQPELAEVLLQAGGEVNAQADDGSTALIKAALWNHPEVVVVLLRYGADADIEDADGWTAQKIAVEKGYAGIVALLSATDCQK